jgi:cytochrome c oxidase subunit II
VWFLFRYRRRGDAKAKFTHGNHAVEMVWTVTPALILVFLALYQMKLWVRLKKGAPEENENPTKVDVLAKQFEWNFRYPGPDGTLATGDDLLTVGGMVVPLGRPVNARLGSLDVIHSFFLPNFRFKQDAVPGLVIPFWFRPTKLSAQRQPVESRDPEALKRGEERWVETKLDYWDIVCAELCGNSHTNMQARLFVVTEEQFAKWLKDPASTPEIPVRWTKWSKDSAMTAQDVIWNRWSWQDRQYEDGDPKKRLLMAPAKLKRGAPLGEDEKPGGSQSQEDI